MLRHAKLMNDVLVGESDLRYLGEYEEDNQRMERPRREERLWTTNGRSPVDRCRRLLNIINKANLTHILCSDKELFMTQFKLCTNKIMEAIERN